MNVGSLFTGIGGFDLGLERAGMRVAWQCERDDFCRRVLAKHWPGVPCYGDVTKLEGGGVPRVDVLCGGFPCQDISLAGKGAGIDGSRSGLWREFARLIGELRPRYVIVENVPALTSRGLDRVLADLAASGFDAEWDHLPASAFGAPHRRDRLWLVAYPHGEGQPAGAIDAGARTRQLVADAPRDVEAGTAAQSGAEREQAGPRGQRGREAAADANGCRCRPGIRELPAGQRDAARSGEAVADPQRFGRDGWAERDGGGTASAQRGGGPGVASDADAPERHEGSALIGDGGQDVADAEVEPVGTGLCEGGSRGQRRGRSGDGGSAHDWWSAEPDVGRVAHGVPARVDRLRSLGNALVPQIAQWIGERIVSWETSR